MKDSQSSYGIALDQDFYDVAQPVRKCLLIWSYCMSVAQIEGFNVNSIL